MNNKGKNEGEPGGGGRKCHQHTKSKGQRGVNTEGGASAGASMCWQCVELVPAGRGRRSEKEGVRERDRES